MNKFQDIKKYKFLRKNFRLIRFLIKSTFIIYLLSLFEPIRGLFLDVIYFSPSYKDLSFGKNQNIEINENIYLKNIYCICTRTEFIDGNIKLLGSDFDKGIYHINDHVDIVQKRFIGLIKDSSSMENPIYTIQVTAYRKGLFQDNLLFRKEYTNFTIGGPVYGSNTDNPRNNAYLVARDCFELPVGRYRFYISDKSKFTSEFDYQKTSIAITPNTNFK